MIELTQSPAAGAALFVYQALCLLGAADITARAVEKWILRARIADGYRILFGTAFLPVIISYAGFMGFGKPPYLAAFVGLVFFVHGAWLAYTKTERSMKKKDFISFLPFALVATGAFVLTLAAKYCYFSGGVNNIDEQRSLVMVSAFAANFLKPAYPLNFAIPISYSYYGYETCAFLYSAVLGNGFPATSLAVFSMATVWFFYRVVYALCEELFPKQTARAFLQTSAIVTCVGFGFVHDIVYKNKYIDFWGNDNHIDILSDLFHWSYMYVFGSTLLLAGLAAFKKFTATRARLDWKLFSMFFLLAGGHAALPFAWAVLSMVFIIAVALYKWRKKFFTDLLKLTPLSAALVALILLPQVFTYIGRDVVFSFTPVPRAWFGGEAVNNSKPLEEIWTALKTVGPLLTLGFFVAIADVFREDRRYSRFFPYNYFVLAAILLLTFTTAPVFDWHTRGSFTAFVLLAFFSADFLLEKKILWAVIAVLLIPQAYNFSLEEWFRFNECKEVSPLVKSINATVPLGGIVYVPDEGTFFQTSAAGRGFLSKPLEHDTALVLHEYNNREDWLKKYIGWDGTYRPCNVTRFGSSTPSNTYFELIPGTAITDAKMKNCSLVQSSPAAN